MEEEMNRTRGWRWIGGVTVAALAMLSPGVARAASVEAQQHGRPAQVQRVTPQGLQQRPAPETRSWGRERDEARDRDWRDEHRDRDRRHAWGRPYWGAPSGWYEPYAPPAPPAPVYVPGQWVWSGYDWVWQPGYWTY
jgi:hypothetical protein